MSDERVAALERAVGDLARALQAIAARLDEIEARLPPSERVEWIGTVQWRGSTRDYEANSEAINHELALGIAEMARQQARQAETKPIEPDSGRSQPNGAVDATARDD